MNSRNRKPHPARLYRYRPLGDIELVQRELDAISKSYLYAPSLERMNDPMEALFEHSGLDDPMAALLPTEFINMQNAILEKTAKIARSSGVISMSETFLDYPLWAYYGSNFSGMCLEFDTQELVVSRLPRDALEAIQVIYDSNAPDLITSESLMFSDPMDIVISRLSQKRIEWQHEREWRYLAGRAGPKPYNDTALKRIYLGPRIEPETKSKIVELMSKRPVEILEGFVRGYEVEFFCIKEGTPWHECERTGAGRFDPSKVLPSDGVLQSVLGENYNALEQKCKELSLHPNVEKVDRVCLINNQTRVCVTAMYRLRDGLTDVHHNHFFDINMKPLCDLQLYRE